MGHYQPVSETSFKWRFTGRRIVVRDSSILSWISSNHLQFVDHFCRTVGMGELNVVLNGIEFRTRHNDYRLRMPSKTKKDYNLMENIDFPPVPPAVLNKKTVHEQVLEMREWFRGTEVLIHLYSFVL